MSGKDDKWSMFKNYMHNELGITKADIREWLQSAVQIEAEKMVNNTFESYSVESLVHNMMTRKEFYGSEELKKELRQEVAKQLLNKFELDLNLKK